MSSPPGDWLICFFSSLVAASVFSPNEPWLQVCQCVPFGSSSPHKKFQIPFHPNTRLMLTIPHFPF
uniref:Secreted protein n=1 Tax=Setaria viridis TaxID=4556 RepID=A0A4V6D9D3_SETVI|nr:hypothetical protein SEVIR_3G098066v2 [Setaria viridis]